MGQQAVQSAHALQAFNVKHPAATRSWYEASNTLAMLSVPNEEALTCLLGRAQERGFLVAPFHEPDRNNEMTALALEPAGRRLVSSLPLALASPT